MKKKIICAVYSSKKKYPQFICDTHNRVYVFPSHLTHGDIENPEYYDVMAKMLSQRYFNTVKLDNLYVHTYNCHTHTYIYVVLVYKHIHNIMLNKYEICDKDDVLSSLDIIETIQNYNKIFNINHIYSNTKSLGILGVGLIGTGFILHTSKMLIDKKKTKKKTDLR